MVDYAYFRDLAFFFLWCVSGGLGNPLAAEELALPMAGIWVARNLPQYGVLAWVMLPVCIVGVLISDVLLYWIGWRFGSRLLDTKWGRRMVAPDKRQRIELNYHRYGVGILFFGRLLPGVRVPLFLTAGILRMPVPRFVLADGLGAILGDGLLFMLGFWIGDSFLALVKQNVQAHRPIIVLCVVGLVILYMAYRFIRRPVPEGDLEKEVPILGHQIAAHMSSAELRVPKKKKEQPENSDGSSASAGGEKKEQEACDCSHGKASHSQNGEGNCTACDCAKYRAKTTGSEPDAKP